MTRCTSGCLERSQQHQELSTHRHRLDTVLSNITAGVITVAPDNTITMINQSAERILQLRAVDVLGHSTIKLGSAFSDIILRTMKEGIPQLLEGVLKRDKAQITNALRLMGFMAYGDDGYDVETLIEYMYGRFLQELSFDSWSLKDIQVDLETKLEMMGDLRKLDISLLDLMATVQMPKDFVLLERTVLLLMGVCTHLQPCGDVHEILRG